MVHLYIIGEYHDDNDAMSYRGSVEQAAKDENIFSIQDKITSMPSFKC